MPNKTWKEVLHDTVRTMGEDNKIILHQFLSGETSPDDLQTFVDGFDAILTQSIQWDPTDYEVKDNDSET